MPSGPVCLSPSLTFALGILCQYGIHISLRLMLLYLNSNRKQKHHSPQRRPRITLIDAHKITYTFLNQLTVWEYNVPWACSIISPLLKAGVRQALPNTIREEQGVGQDKHGNEEEGEMCSMHNKTIIHCMPNTVCMGESVLSKHYRYKKNIVLSVISNRYPAIFGNYFCSPGIQEHICS